MSNAAWNRRRLGRWLDHGLRRIAADPQVTVRLPGGLVLISAQRWQRLREGVIE